MFMSDTIKEAMRGMWGSIDYSVYANRTPTPLMSERLCESIDLRAGQRVLDVATGSGNTAVAAARRWCTVIGIDYVSMVLDRARAIAESQSVPVTFQQGDAENLEIADASFDAVISTLGVMFAPDQQRAAAEMVRVCKPGGHIGVASWTPQSLLGQMFRIVAQFIPPADTVQSPLRWGTEQGVWELFGERVRSIDATIHNLTYRFESPAKFVVWLSTYLNPMRTALAKLEEARQEELAAALVEVAERMNRSGDETFLAPAYYLQLVAVR